MRHLHMAMAFLGILTLIGVFLLGTGINGMVVSETERSLCAPKIDCLEAHIPASECPDSGVLPAIGCPEGQVCCLFSGEDAGVCHSEDMCDEITAITKHEKEANIQTPMPQDNVRNFHLEAILGGIIIILAILAILYLLRHKASLTQKKHASK